MKLTLAFLALTGCAAVKPACAVVNLMNDACMLLTFADADGTVHTVQCSRSELQQWGAYVEAKHTKEAEELRRTNQSACSTPGRCF